MNSPMHELVGLACGVGCSGPRGRRKAEQGQSRGRAGAELLPGRWGCEEVHPGEAGSLVTVGWFPEVTLPG